MIEIEKKYRIDEAQRSAIEAQLSELGATFAGTEHEENTIFGGGVLDEKHAVLRIRSTPTKTILTFKQRLPGESDYKQQLEHEAEFRDAGALSTILESLGFERRVIYEKIRSTYRFRDNEIVIDKLPFGLFMEIEGSITSIKEAEMYLGIEDWPVEHDTYPRLTARVGLKIEDRIESRFESET